MLAEDPSVFGLIYTLKFSCNSSYFIGQVSKNTSLNCGNTNSDGLVHSPQHPLCGQTQPEMRHASQGCARQAHQWHVYSQQAGGSCHIGGRIGCVISYFQDELIAKLVIRYWRVQTLKYI